MVFCAVASIHAQTSVEIDLQEQTAYLIRPSYANSVARKERQLRRSKDQQPDHEANAAGTRQHANDISDLRLD
jgi:hypothetical protein